MKKEQIAKSVFYVLNGFKISIGEQPYPQDWNSQKDSIKELFYGGIDLIQENPNISPEEIHIYWNEWAKKHNPGHKSLIPFSDLSFTEKQKDFLFIQAVRSFFVKL